jgi:hypothetical protein
MFVDLKNINVSRNLLNEIENPKCKRHKNVNKGKSKTELWRK